MRGDLSPHPQSGTGPHTLPSHVRVPGDMAPLRPQKPGSREMAELPGALSSSCLLPPPASVMDAGISYVRLSLSLLLWVLWASAPPASGACCRDTHL